MNELTRELIRQRTVAAEDKPRMDRIRQINGFISKHKSFVNLFEARWKKERQNDISYVDYFNHLHQQKIKAHNKVLAISFTKIWNEMERRHRDIERDKLLKERRHKRILEQNEQDIIPNEEWRTVDQIPPYECSNMGRFRNKKATRILHGSITPNGYVHISLTNNGISRTYQTHRLIAKTFLPISDKPQVNHLDRNRSNNKVTNLEWVTSSENTQHWLNRPKSL